jgi:hypothetical protein
VHREHWQLRRILARGFMLWHRARKFMLLYLHVLDSYVELRDDRRPFFAFFFAAWPELKTRVLTLRARLAELL